MGKPTAETNRKLQTEFRERKKANGLEEVRGIYLPKSLHSVIKAYAKAISEVKARTG